MNAPFALNIKEVRAASCVFEIYMAGDINDAKRELAKIASELGACWSVDSTEYIYSGGRELGFVVRTINYPRFPKPISQLEEEAVTTAKKLMKKLGQGSCSVVGPEETVWLTRRKEDTQ